MLAPTRLPFCHNIEARIKEDAKVRNNRRDANVREIKTKERLVRVSEIQMSARLNSNERHKINISKIC